MPSRDRACSLAGFEAFPAAGPSRLECLTSSASAHADLRSRDLTTGLPNRRAIQHLLRSTQLKGASPDTLLWVALVRLHELHHGSTHHRIAPGDPHARRHRLMRRMGRALAKLVGTSGIVGRWSSDEMVVIVSAAVPEDCDAVLRWLFDLSEKLPDSSGLQLMSGILDPARLHEEGYRLAETIVS